MAAHRAPTRLRGAPGLRLKGVRCLAAGDYDRLEAFHSQSHRKILHIKGTRYTQILDPTARVYTNQKIHALPEQRPLTHHIHKAQLTLFGHILRSHPHNTERICCLARTFQFQSFYRWVQA